jgi:hypothetical protein
MQCYYDNRSDAWQEADKGQTFAERIELVETTLQAVEDLQSG